VLGVGEGGGGWAFSLNSLAELGPVGAISTSLGASRTPAAVFWDRDRRAASAYSRQLGGALLTFRGSSDGIFDIESGTRWTVDGLAVEGPLVGERLDRIRDGFMFFPLTWIWGVHEPPEPR